VNAVSSISRRLAVAQCALAVLLTLALGVLIALLALDSSYAESLSDKTPDVLMAVTLMLVGVVVTLQRPENLVGWAMSVPGVVLLAGGVLEAYANLALLAKPEAGLPGGTVALALSGGVWTALIAGLFVLLLVFPAGRIPRRWRLVTRLVLVGLGAVWAIITTWPGQSDPPFDAYENPLAFTNTTGYTAVVAPIVVACVVCVVVAAAGLLLRFRRSRGEERQQFKWFAGSAGLLLVSLPLQYFSDSSGVTGPLFLAAVLALPVSVGIAILRYRLYEIDVIVRRTLVYGVVTAALAGLYFAIVVLLQQVFSSFAGGSDLAVAGSTLAVAALFRPVRNRIQAIVDRRFYRRKYDTQHTLETFSGRLREQVDLEALSAELQRVVGETMQPASVSLWLRAPGGRE
jgi:hypothetical protein